MLKLIFIRKRFFRDSRGVVALEFAITAPLLILFMAGAFDITQVLMTQERMSVAANAIAEMITNKSANSNGTNQIYGSDAETAATAIFAYLPQWKNISQSLYSVTMTSIQSTTSVPGCTSNCVYVLSPAWSASMMYGTAERRSCLPMLRSPPAPSSFATLPASLFSSAPLIVVDINYTYKPLFIGFFISQMVISRSAYLTPRTGSDSAYVTYYNDGTVPQATASTQLGWVKCF